jgi:hypothetical protein
MPSSEKRRREEEKVKKSKPTLPRKLERLRDLRGTIERV